MAANERRASDPRQVVFPIVLGICIQDYKLALRTRTSCSLPPTWAPSERCPKQNSLPLRRCSTHCRPSRARLLLLQQVDEVGPVWPRPRQPPPRQHRAPRLRPLLPHEEPKGKAPQLARPTTRRKGNRNRRRRGPRPKNRPNQVLGQFPQGYKLLVRNTQTDSLRMAAENIGAKG